MICVDPLMKCVPTAKWPYNSSCHLFSDQDDPAQLHDFADRLGLRRSWFQDDPRLPHYDLTPGMRARAVALGVHSVDFVAVSREMERRKKRC